MRNSALAAHHFKDHQRAYVMTIGSLISRLHDKANIEQISSTYQAKMKHLEHTSCTCILNTFA